MNHETMIQDLKYEVVRIEAKRKALKDNMAGMVMSQWNLCHRQIAIMDSYATVIRSRIKDLEKIRANRSGNGN